MAKGNAVGISAEQRTPSKHKQDGSSVQKREFLKRKTQQAPQMQKQASSKYKYYADNFNPQAKQERPASR